MPLTKVGNIVNQSPSTENLFINGDMRIAQRGTSFTGLTEGDTNTYTLDRWKYNEASVPDSVVTITQDTEVPAGYGFVNSLKIDVTTAETFTDTNSTVFIRQAVEAKNLTHLQYGSAEAKALTLTWHMKSTKTGNMGLVIYQDNGIRQYTTKVTIPDSNWNKYTVVIPGDTSGVIDNDYGAGLHFMFMLAGGSTTEGSTDNEWAAWAGYYDTSIANLLDNTSNNIYFTGMQLEVGEIASDFKHRPFGLELSLCQRYYEKSYNLSTDPGTATDVGAITVISIDLGCPGCQFKVEKRVSPTITIYDDGGDIDSVYNVTDATDETVLSVPDICTSGFRVIATSVPSTSPARLQYHWTADAEL
jgi:hypothetical protein